MPLVSPIKKKTLLFSCSILFYFNILCVCVCGKKQDRRIKNKTGQDQKVEFADEWTSPTVFCAQYAWLKSSSERNIKMIPWDSSPPTPGLLWVHFKLAIPNLIQSYFVKLFFSVPSFVISFKALNFLLLILKNLLVIRPIYTPVMGSRSTMQIQSLIYDNSFPQTGWGKLNFNNNSQSVWAAFMLLRRWDLDSQASMALLGECSITTTMYR